MSHAIAAGVPASRLRSRNLESPFRGVRTRRGEPEAETPQDAIRARALAFAVRMTPHTFFSHVTAAVLWNIALPITVLDLDYLDLAVFSPRRNPRGKAIRGHELDADRATVRIHPEHEVPLTSAATTWATLARVLPHPYDLVAAADSLICTPQHPNDPPATAVLAQLVAAAGAGRRLGVGALRGALPRVRDGARSRPESWLRLTIVDGGLPEPEVAWVVHDRLGAFIGRVDLAYPRWKIAIEYEGDHHRVDAGQWNTDILRYERLVAEGWTVIRVTKRDLFSRADALLARIRAAIAGARR